MRVFDTNPCNHSNSTTCIYGNNLCNRSLSSSLYGIIHTYNNSSNSNNNSNSSNSSNSNSSNSSNSNSSNSSNKQQQQQQRQQQRQQQQQPQQQQQQQKQQHQQQQQQIHQQQQQQIHQQQQQQQIQQQTAWRPVALGPDALHQSGIAANIGADGETKPLSSLSPPVPTSRLATSTSTDRSSLGVGPVNPNRDGVSMRVASSRKPKVVGRTPDETSETAERLSSRPLSVVGHNGQVGNVYSRHHQGYALGHSGTAVDPKHAQLRSSDLGPFSTLDPHSGSQTPRAREKDSASGTAPEPSLTLLSGTSAGISDGIGVSTGVGVATSRHTQGFLTSPATPLLQRQHQSQSNQQYHRHHHTA
ncbi:hypothetical protein BASA81_013375 [Batrachochytrium salamandrivorans]|nr:hypothetical protein BASA81_013375 [Batrachochytrium salamandrivorans]